MVASLVKDSEKAHESSNIAGLTLFNGVDIFMTMTNKAIVHSAV
jgi:hypothetical protein